MKNQNLQQELIDRKAGEILKNVLESYSSRRQFKQLTKNIPRLHKTTANEGSSTSHIKHELIKNQVQIQKNCHINESTLQKQSLQMNSQMKNGLKRSASTNHFTSQNLEKIKNKTNNRQIQQKDSAFKDLQSYQNSIYSKNNPSQKLSSRALKRFKPLVSMLLFQVAINIMFGIPALYMFFTLDSMFKKYLATIQYCFITLFYVASSFYIVWGCGRKGLIEFFMMHILIDTLLLILVVVSIGFIGMLTVFFSDQWFSWVNVVGIPVMNFFFIGNFRLFLKWVILSPWQIILWKITFFIDGMIYFGIGAYYMAVDYKLTQGYLPEVQSKLKDFCLLFVFANFSLYIEMFGAIGGKDKTEDLQYQYVMSQESDEENDDLKNNSPCKYCLNCNRSNQFKNDKINIQKNIYQNFQDCNEPKSQGMSSHLDKKLFEIPEQSPIGRQEKLISVECKNQEDEGDLKNGDGERMFFTINKINWSKTKSQSHQFGISSL